MKDLDLKRVFTLERDEDGAHRSSMILPTMLVCIVDAMAFFSIDPSINGALWGLGFIGVGLLMCCIALNLPDANSEISPEDLEENIEDRRIGDICVLGTLMTVCAASIVMIGMGVPFELSGALMAAATISNFVALVGMNSAFSTEPRLI
jgi:hypothetical protein